MPWYNNGNYYIDGGGNVIDPATGAPVGHISGPDPLAPAPTFTATAPAPTTATTSSGLQSMNWVNGLSGHFQPNSNGSGGYLYSTPYASSDSRIGYVQPQQMNLFNALNNPNATWQDLLSAGFQEGPNGYASQIYGQNYNQLQNLTDRMNATGWTDAQKREAVLRGINNSYAQDASGWTMWSNPEGIAAGMGLPIDQSRNAQEQQAFQQGHTNYTEQQDAESMANALVIGGGLAGAWLGPGGLLGDMLGGAGAGAAEEIAALTGSGGAGGAGAVGGATGGLGSLPGVDPSWGVTTGPSTPNGLQTFIGDPALGGMGGVTPDLTALAPTQNLGTGSLFNGAVGGAGAGLGTALSSLPSVPPVPPAGGGGGGSTTVDPGGGTFDAGGMPNYTSPPATTGQGSPLSRIIEAMTGGGTPSMADILSVGGTLGSTLLGMYGSNQQGDALRDIANQSRADRQPFLNKSLEWLNDPAAYAAGPGKASLDATLRALSVQGNPFGSPTSLAIAGDIANRGWQNAVTGFGNLGLAGQDSRNQLLTGAVQADSGALNSLGYGLENLLNPRPQNSQLNNLLRQFGLV